MRRFILGFIVGWIVMLAPASNAQQNLDTLWTRTFSSPGNEVFYAMAEANDGNILVAAYLDGVEGFEAGRYMIEIEPDGDLFSIFPIPSEIQCSEVSGLRETEDDNIELCFNKYIFKFNGTDGVLSSDTIPLDTCSGNSYGESWRATRKTSHVRERQYLAAGIFGAWGYEHYWGYWSYSYSFAALFDFATNSSVFYTTYNNSDGFCSLGGECFVIYRNASNWLVMTRRCGDTFGFDITQSIPLPNDYLRFLALPDSGGFPWLYSRGAGRPFVSIHMKQDAEEPVTTTVPDSLAPTPISAAVDSLGNLVIMGYRMPTLPLRGLRLDVVDNETGALGVSVSVDALQSAEPSAFVLLDDNSAIVASKIAVGQANDLVLCRTEPVPTGHFEANSQPPSLELLIEGPPAWGYRVNTRTNSVEALSFNGICIEASTQVTGRASITWSGQVLGSGAIYTTTNAFNQFTLIDTLWLVAPACESGEVTWTIDTTFGVIPGPLYHAPIEPSVELLVSESPVWGYRVRAGTFSQDELILDDLCLSALTSDSSHSSGGWTVSRAGHAITFTAQQPIQSNSVSDTLWLIAPGCLEGSLRWMIDTTSGEIAGPRLPGEIVFPEGFLRMFYCRVEDRGIRVRFALIDTPELHSIKIWRKSVLMSDSLLLGFAPMDSEYHEYYDTTVVANRTYTYTLTALDDYGRNWPIEAALQTVFVDGSSLTPSDYAVRPPYPNPFNASTTIEYDIPAQTPVSLKLYDVTGRQVATLLDEFKDAGSYQLTFDAHDLASGVYFYSFNASRFSKQGKLLLLK